MSAKYNFVFFGLVIGSFIMSFVDIALDEYRRPDNWASEKTKSKLAVPQNSILRKLALIEIPEKYGFPLLYTRILHYLFFFYYSVIAILLYFFDQVIINLFIDKVLIIIAFVEFGVLVLYQIIFIIIFQIFRV